MADRSSPRRPEDAFARATTHIDRAEELLWECTRDLPDNADDEFARLFEGLWAVQNELAQVSFPGDCADERGGPSRGGFDFPTTDD
ncbi:hypothetical protein [Haloferax sulfurifontis]|nr:hypothetical protein [Haloferax sulfurifontis]ELZ89126.1 hypothetical protein C441_16564 [Haloferax sulfurifontis ATCC BAA-897]